MYTPEMIKVFAAGESDVRIQRALSAAAQREDIFQAVAKPKQKYSFADPHRWVNPNFRICNDETLAEVLETKLEQTTRRHVEGIRSIIRQNQADLTVMNGDYNEARFRTFMRKQKRSAASSTQKFFDELIEPTDEIATFSSSQNDGGLMVEERTDVTLDLKISQLEAAMIKVTREHLQSALARLRQQADYLAMVSDPELMSS